MDYIDVLEGRFYQTYTGKYYERMAQPVKIEDKGELYKRETAKIFDYEHVDVISCHYKQLLFNLIDTDGRNTVIKTKEPLSFRVGSFVILSDGKTYVIREVREDTREANRESARLMIIPCGIFRLLVLSEQENAWTV